MRAATHHEYLDVYQVEMGNHNRNTGQYDVVAALESDDGYYDGIDTLALDDGIDYADNQPPIAMG